jgi:hypothetical protein
MVSRGRNAGRWQTNHTSPALDQRLLPRCATLVLSRTINRKPTYAALPTGALKRRFKRAHTTRHGGSSRSFRSKCRRKMRRIPRTRFTCFPRVKLPPPRRLLAARPPAQRQPTEARQDERFCCGESDAASRSIDKCYFYFECSVHLVFQVLTVCISFGVITLRK